MARTSTNPNPYRNDDNWVASSRLRDFATKYTKRETSTAFWKWVVQNRSDIIRMEKHGKFTYVFVPDLKAYIGVKDG